MPHNTLCIECGKLGDVGYAGLCDACLNKVVQKLVKPFMGWDVKRRGGMITLYANEDPRHTNGISVVLNKSTRELGIAAWYDGCMGISGGTLKMDDLVKFFQRSRHERKSNVRQKSADADGGAGKRRPQ